MESIQTNDPVLVDPTAVFGRRCFAYIIDLVIMFVVAVVAISSLASLREVPDPDSATRICKGYEDLDNGDVCLDLESAVFVLEADKLTDLGILMIAVAVLNLVIIPSITGGSLGKLAVGIRVVNKSTFEKAGFGRHLLRWILLIVDSFPWFLVIPLTGLILGLSSRGHRRVGDFAARTLVVNKSYVGTPTLVRGVNDDVVSTMPSAGLWEPPIQPAPAQPPLTAPIAPVPITEQPTYAADLAPNTSGDVDVEEHSDVEQNHDPEPEPAPEPEVASEEQGLQPGVDAPMWDEARNTHIQWDPQLDAWMEWSESAGQWIPISQ